MRTRRAVALGVVPIVLALVLAGCGGGGDGAAKKPKPTATQPTGSVAVPTGTALTTPGSKLRFGQPASVAYEMNPQRGSVLRVTVRRAVQGRIADLSAYSMDAATSASTPYYVTIAVTNTGKGDLSGGDVPVWAVDNRNALVHASRFSNRFATCPSTPLPRPFGPGATAVLCQLYLVPNHGKLAAMSYRPVQRVEPISWTGHVVTPAEQMAAQKRAAAAKKKAAAAAKKAARKHAGSRKKKP